MSFMKKKQVFIARRKIQTGILLTARSVMEFGNIPLTSPKKT